MRWNDYLDEVEQDAKEALKEAYDYDPNQSWESAYDDLFCDDSVTGNGSGSYTFSTVQAEENVAGIIFDEEFVGYCRDMGWDGVPTEKGAEAVDVIARCAALQHIAGSLENYWDELTEETEVPVQIALGESIREFLEEFGNLAQQELEEYHGSDDPNKEYGSMIRLFSSHGRVIDWLDTVASECGY